MLKVKPVLILHGGAGPRTPSDARHAEIQKKLRRILDAAYARLLRSTALEAAALAVRMLEDDPYFNAGTGACLQADGRARLSASVMDGDSGRFAAVINVENIKNPVRIAQALLKEKSRVLDGAGAAKFAKKLGMKKFDVRTAESLRRWKKQARGHDTVGACALDACGRLACATSTGGRGMEFPGRVSDSGMPVANFADGFSAVCASGIGEEIIEEGLCIRIAQRVRDGMDLAEAFRRTFREVRSNDRRMGAVGLDRRGRAAYAHTTESLLYAWRKGAKISIF